MKVRERTDVAAAAAEQELLSVGRRKFSLAAALAILSGAAITISSAACGSDSPSGPNPAPTPTPTPTPGASDKTGNISGNHGHSAVITGAQITAANAIQLNIQGSATHPHSVSLSASEVVAIGANQQVSKESSSENGHSHTVTFN